MSIIHTDINLPAKEHKHNILLMTDCMLTPTMLADTFKVYWKTVDMHPMYLVSSDGDVYSIRRHKILKPGISGSGYYKVMLDADQLYIHRLVAKAFLFRDSSDKTEVDHIDHNRHNNDVHNLQWITPSDNRRKRVIQYRGQAVLLTLHTDLQDINDCHVWARNLRVAADWLGLSYSTFLEVLHDHIPSYKGFTVKIMPHDDYELLFGDNRVLGAESSVYTDSEYMGHWAYRNTPIYIPDMDVVCKSREEAYIMLGVTEDDHDMVEITKEQYKAHGLTTSEYIMLYGVSEGDEN